MKPAHKDTVVRVVSVTQDGLPEASVEETFERLEWASYRRPDIACLPEIFAGRKPVSLSDPVVERAQAWAQAHSCYLICPVRVAVADRVFNSAIVIDRRGEVIGRYDKIHPTESEIEDGTRPGDLDPPVFQTDFGVIGVQICFDVNWWEAWFALKAKGAQIIFWPSAYPAARQLAALAWKLQCYLVSATLMRQSRIYDITGDELSRSGTFQPWTEATLNLGKRLFEIDYHLDQMNDLQRKYGDRVAVEWHHDEDWFTLTSLDPSVSTQDLMAEFGLVPVTEYHARCGRAQAKARR